MKRKLRSLYISFLLDQRCVRLRRFLFELRRTLTFRKRVVSVFLQLDDPYSYLLAHYLEHVMPRYRHKVEFRFYLCQALGGEFTPQPGMLAEYALQDCKLLAREFGIPFLDVGTTPAVEFRRALLDFLAAEHDEEDFADTFIKALTLYWRGDSEGVTRLMGRSYGESSETNVLVGRNQLLLRKMGHYNSSTMHYGGEWFWGVDRLLYLTRLLDRQKLNRYKDPVPELASMVEAMRIKLPATPPAAARDLPPLELFYSFRSPYSYIALKSAFAIAKSFGLRLEVRPLLPMVMTVFPCQSRNCCTSSRMPTARQDDARCRSARSRIRLVKARSDASRLSITRRRRIVNSISCSIFLFSVISIPIERICLLNWFP